MPYPDRNAYPDRFYPVVDTLDWLRRLTGLGVGTVQLRAKDLADGESLQLVSDALEIVKGRGRRATAERLGITDGTARSHLSKIFDKTGVSRQAELVRLVLQK